MHSPKSFSDILTRVVFIAAVSINFQMFAPKWSAEALDDTDKSGNDIPDFDHDGDSVQHCLAYPEVEVIKKPEQFASDLLILASFTLQIIEETWTAILIYPEQIVDPQEKAYYTCLLELLIQKIGKNYKRIILSVYHNPLVKVDMVGKSLTRVFINAIEAENEVRKREGQEIIKVLVHISFKPPLERSDECQLLEMTLGNYEFYERVISGILYDSGIMVQNKMPEEDSDQYFESVVESILVLAVHSMKITSIGIIIIFLYFNVRA